MVYTTVLVAVGAGVSHGQPPTTRVVAIEARMLDAAKTITLVGTVEPARVSRVASEVAGLAVSVPARQGDRVARGDVLAELDGEALALEVAQEKAQLEARKARHEELLSGTRPEDLIRLKALLDETSAEDGRWTLEMERIKELYEGRDSNAKELYDTKAEFQKARRRRIAAQAMYDLGVAGPRREVIARAKHEVAEQRAVVKRLERDLAKKLVRAPFAGFVVERGLEVGEWLDEGGEVVQLVDLSTVLVRVNAPEYAFPFIHPGDAVRVKIDALKRSFNGRVKHMIRLADETARTFPVEIEISNDDGSLSAGMFARASVPAGTAQRVVAVPKDAVVHRDGIDYVAQLAPDHKGGMVGVLVPITIGADVGDWIAVTSGNIKMGARVITRGSEKIMPFPTTVIVVDAKGTPVADPSPGDTPRVVGDPLKKATGDSHGSSRTSLEKSSSLRGGGPGGDRTGSQDRAID